MLKRKTEIISLRVNFITVKPENEMLTISSVDTHHGLLQIWKSNWFSHHFRRTVRQ